MKRNLRVACFGASGLLALGAARAADTMEPGAQRALIDKYCMDCHNYTDYAGGVEFEIFDPGKAHEEAKLVERMLRKLRAGMMPPAGKPRPDFETIQNFAKSLESDVDHYAKPDLHEPQLHRLNRAEYANAVRDLLGLEIDSTKFLTADDSSRGFDNQAGALTLSPALLEAYLSAAARVSGIAMGTATAPAQVTYRVAEDTTQNYHVAGLPFGTRGGLKIDHTFPADGDYTLKVFSVNLGNMGNFRPFGEVRGEQLLFFIDDRKVATVDWDKALHVDRRLEEDFLGNGQLTTIDVKQHIKAGLHHIGVTFAATDYAPGLDMNHAFDRSTIETGGLPGFTFYPHVGSVRIDGPDDGKAATESPTRQRIFVCHPGNDSDAEPCARQIATTLARHAYRGFATQKDIETLMGFYRAARADGGTFDSGVEAILQRLLSDPKFVYRVESTPPDLVPGTAYKVSDLDLASRLSFFLWSSIPDDTLLQLAQAHELTKPAVLRQQVQRMLADPRASALTANFAGQWLGLRNLAAHAPVVDQFPDFDDNLRQAFRREVELLFQSLLDENRSVLDLLTADYTFVNERLAQFYGIAGVKGSYFRRIKLDASQSARWGLLGKGAVLTISSQPGRTSPVIRGNWVLRNVIGVPAPDPPANVPALPVKKEDVAGNTHIPTMREQMEEHRRNPACAGCHKMMDPIGFALEPFDAIGHLRTQDRGSPIDARGQLYDGTPVDGPAGVRAFLLKHQDQYLRNVTENLMTYALGRGMDYADMPEVRKVMESAAPDGYRLEALVTAVVLSDNFSMNVVPDADPVPAKTGTAAVPTPLPAPAAHSSGGG